MKTFKTDEDLFDELKDKYTKLITANRTLFEENVARGKRIDAMTKLLDEAMAVFKTYLNVPEAVDLKAKWEKLKAPTSQ